MDASERIEALVARCEAIQDAELRADVLELLQLILAVHGDGMEQMLRAVAEAPHVDALLAAWRRKEVVMALLELHGLELPERRPEPAAEHGDFVPVAALSRGE